MIHESSIVSSKAKIGKDVVIGPFCRIHDGVTLGDGCYLDSHVVLGSVSGEVIIGKNNKFYGFSLIGGPPQDLKYKGENTKLVVGDGNTFRESVTVSIGTSNGGGETRIGNNNLLMAYCHIGHDDKIGNNNVIANSVQLAGHVTIEDKVTLGGICAVNQFVRIGKNSFIAGGALVNKDALPFSITQGAYAVARATNKIGMERSGYSEQAIQNINRAIRILTRGSGTIDEALKRIDEECEKLEEVLYLIDFIKKSERGVAI
ncbi:MAG: acyl-ACP--UDP-N-acetylglucosamine O-acyltransferase [Oligoflexia bacterium]|nr:acyl-ACP--UDP-N-acetylglucosamine O-acyltransferase [Oligoflexia bacterium]